MVADVTGMYTSRNAARTDQLPWEGQGWILHVSILSPGRKDAIWLLETRLRACVFLQIHHFEHAPPIQVPMRTGWIKALLDIRPWGSALKTAIEWCGALLDLRASST